MKTRLGILVLVFGLGLNTLFSDRTGAATFNPNRLMDDVIFSNADTMNTAQIDGWLNSNFGSTSCISTDHGFSAPDPTGYNPTRGFIYGGNVSAGRVIYDAAQAYGLNPQVLLTTLQKEQSLVSGTSGCSTLRYAAATGYGCPDGGTTHTYSGLNLYSINGKTVTSVTGTCVNTSLKAGFSQQVIRAAWLLKFGQQRSEGNINWAVIKGNWDNSDDPQSCYGGPMTQGTWQRCPSGGSAFYDGYTTIDSTATHMDNGATAALYWYTPHFSGNQNFDTIFSTWFVSVYAPAYSWQWLAQGLYSDQTKTISLDPSSNLAAGKRYYTTISLMKTGNRNWTHGKDRLATVIANHSKGYVSVNGNFYDSSWASKDRIGSFTQASVAPGQTATFEFWVTTPPAPGFVRDNINLVDDSVSWFQNNQGVNVWANTKTNYSWRWLNQGLYADQTKSLSLDPNSNLAAGKRYYTTLTLTNTSNVLWQQGAVRLATVSPDHNKGYKSIDGNFYDSSWVSKNRIGSFTEASVAPGQTATFEFWIMAPSQPALIKDYINVVNDSISWFYNNQGVNVWANTPTNYKWQWLGQGLYADQTKAVAVNPQTGTVTNHRYYVTLTVRNKSNVTWAKGPVRLATVSPDHSHGYLSVDGNFYDSTWINKSRIGSLQEASAAPGQTGTFEFWITAPGSPGFVRDYLNLVNDGVSWFQNNQGVNVWAAVN